MQYILLWQILTALGFGAVVGSTSFYVGSQHAELALQKKIVTSKVCMGYLQDAAAQCENSNVDGLYYTLGQFYEQCVVDDTWDAERRIQAYADWIEKSLAPKCN